MKIAKETVVTMSYRLTNESGEELDKSDPGEPMVYLHGVGQLVPGLEAHLEGLKAGDARDELKVLPEDAYGQVREDLRLSVKRNQFPKDVDLQPGMQFMASSPGGEQHPFTVVKVSKDDVHVDGNHPLAGQTLFFAVQILEVRAATKEELEHGHAHGPGGHHHH